MNIKQNTFSRLCFFFFRGKIEKIEGKKNKEERRENFSVLRRDRKGHRMTRFKPLSITIKAVERVNLKLLSDFSIGATTLVIVITVICK